MEQIVPWPELRAVIEPYYRKAGKGRPPVGLDRMLRMYFVQHWFNLADEACEEALLDSTALRRFVDSNRLEAHLPGAQAPHGINAPALGAKRLLRGRYGHRAARNRLIPPRRSHHAQPLSPHAVTGLKSAACSA